MLSFDKGVNDERMAYLYDGNKISALEKVAKPQTRRGIKLPGITRSYKGSRPCSNNSDRID